MTEWAKGKAYRSAGGCNEDCLNCKYEDCYKPAREMKTDELTKSALSVARKVNNSNCAMYTLELGGVGRNMPNISKKYYL